MDNKMLSEALISMLGAVNVRTGELMKTHTTFRIGGAADYYVTPQAEKQIACKVFIQCIKHTAAHSLVSIRFLIIV